MAACGEPGEDAALYDTVQGRRPGAVPGARHRRPGRQGFSLSMRTQWTDDDGDAQAGHRAGEPDRHRLRHARRRARARSRRSCEPRRHHADPDRPRPRPAAAWAARSWRRCSTSSATRCPTSTTRQLLKALVAAINALRARRPAARLPRPQRRRPVGRGVRDGVCRPPGREPQRRPARHRRRRHQRQPRRIRRRQELGRRRSARAASELTLEALFNEELGAVIQVRDRASATR